jgi:hypothetical protein
MLSPYKEVLFVGYRSGEVRVWGLTEFNPRQTVKIGETCVRHLAYSERHEWLVTGSSATYENELG